MTARPDAILIATPSDVTAAAALSASGTPLVAGNHHVASRLAAAGLTAVPGDALLDVASKRAVLEAVADFARRVADIAPATGQTEAEWVILRAEMVRAMFAHVAFARAEEVLGLPILRLPDRLRPEAGRRPARMPLPSARRHLRGAPRAELAGPSGPSVIRDTVFDLRARSGLKLGGDEHGTRFLLKTTRNPRWMNAAENLVARVSGGRARVLKLSVPRLRDTPHDPLPPIPGVDPEARAMLEAVASVVADEFRMHRSAMRGLVARTGTPRRALFNNMGNAGLAGYFAALAEAGVPCEMVSHGCLLRTGDPRHDDVAAILGPVIHNSFPGLAEIVPRSPLQEADAYPGQAIRRPVRLSPPGGPEPEPAPFRILHAPNFQAWQGCYHGMTIDCFETRRVAEVLARAVATRPAVTLAIRVKVTADDRSRAGQTAIRGLLPEDLTDLIDARAGITDASVGSHSGHMAAADLVVTEGLTAVMFEALEMRRPVLLLTPPHLSPSLPAMRARDLRDGAPRAAVYHATTDDDLPAILDALARHHAGRPLQDDELGAYVHVP